MTEYLTGRAAAEARGFLDFVVVGAQKAGTTTLHQWLQQDHRISLPARKETHYFSTPERWARGWDWYVESFGKDSADFRAEVDPDYLSELDAARRIRSVVGDVAIVVILRDPLARSYSQYLMSVRRAQESRPFSEALHAEFETLESEGPVHFSRDYLWRSLYGRHIARFTESFSQVHLVHFEDLFDRTGTGDTCYDNLVRFAIGRPSQAPRDFGLSENQRSTARNKALAALIWRKDSMTPLRRVARALVPTPRLRYRVGRSLDRWNRSSQGTIAPMPPVSEISLDVRRLIDRELRELSADTGFSTTTWRERLSV